MSLRFDSLGSRKFADLTTKNVGNRFAIVLDNKVISAPVIQEPIPTGNAQISGNFTFETANDLAILLRAGSLPAPISIAEERTVGQVGRRLYKSRFKIIGDSICFSVGLYVYNLWESCFDSKFCFNCEYNVSCFLVSAFKCYTHITWNCRYSSTVGMAVDANVLIFERIREEQTLGRSKISAIDTGFSQAFRAILDANVTTFIAALILFFIGFGPIRGFSISLILGVFSTIICTMVISRLLIYYYYINNKTRELKL